MTLLNLGTILKPKGLDGTVKVYSTTDFADIRYKIGNKLFLHNEKNGTLIEVTVKKHYTSQQFDYVTFEEYPSLESIEPFIQWKIVIDKDNAPIEEGLYYFCDMIGCKIIDEKLGDIGTCVSIDEFVGKRSLRIKLKNNKEILVPYIDVFVKNIDIDNKTINVKLIDGMVE